MRCNWTTEFGNARYIKPQTQGRNHKFTVDSRHACIKLPMQCKVRSHPSLPSLPHHVSSFQTVDYNQARYDISGLFKQNGFWRVQNYTDGSLLMNICGQMETKLFAATAKNNCSDTDAQICHHNGANYESRGSLAGDLTVNGDQISVTFSEGSPCRRNASISSRTDVELRCAEVEKGPVFKGEINCISHVLWETPDTCPFYVSKQIR